MTQTPKKPPRSGAKRGSRRAATPAKNSPGPASKSTRASKRGRNGTAAKKGRSDERRAAKRFAVGKLASASFDLGRSLANCGIVDISETGARLRFANPRAIPGEFTLFVEEDGFLVDCEVIWRREGRLGVRFSGDKVPTVGQRAVYVDHPLTATGRKKRLARGAVVISKDPPHRETEPPRDDDGEVPPRRVIFGKRDWPT